MIKERLSKFIVLTTQVLFAYVTVINAQGPAAAKPDVIFPVVPVSIEYEFAQQYFSQWIDEHPQYSKIEAIVSLGDDPTLEIALTEKEGGRRVFYTNSEAVVSSLLAEKKEALLTKIDFKTTQAVDQQPNYGFGFLDKAKQPVLWRVIPASRPSQRGRELIPSAWAEGLRVEYRDLATAVGAGSAVQIGSNVFEARPWKEISNPPYFVAYRGTVAIGRHLGTLLPGRQTWKVTKQPEKLENNAEWVLADGEGGKGVWRVVSYQHNEIVVDEVDATGSKNALYRLVMHQTPKGISLRALEIRSRRQEMRIKFDPELPLRPEDNVKFEGRFSINQGQYKDIVSGSILAERTGDALRLRWQPTSPGWTRSKELQSLIHFVPNGYSLETTQVGK